MDRIIVEKDTREPGLYASQCLISKWDKLVETGQVIIKGSVMTRCYLDDPGNLILPEGITEIGDGCFKDCSNLYSISLPSTIKEVGYGAFFGCTDIEYISVKDITAISSVKFR